MGIDDITNKYIVKFDIDVIRKLLLLKLPESNEINYPADIYIYRSFACEVILDKVNSPRDYLESLYWHRDCGNRVLKIGDTDVDDLRDVIKGKISVFSNDIELIQAKYKNFNARISKIMDKIEVDCDADVFTEKIRINQISYEIQSEINMLRNRLPRNTCTLYPKK